VTLTPLFAGVRVRESSGDVDTPEALAVCPRPGESPPAVAGPCSNPVHPGAAAGEHFGGVQNVLKASLTELEATGIQPSPHQSLGTGQSMELAHGETRSGRRCFRRLSG
jgi:hypothetical protein